MQGIMSLRRLGVQVMTSLRRLRVHVMMSLRRLRMQVMTSLRMPGVRGMAVLRRPAQAQMTTPSHPPAPCTVEVHGELSAHAHTGLLEESHHKGRQSSSFSFLSPFSPSGNGPGFRTGCQEGET